MSMHVLNKWSFLWRQARDQIKSFNIYYFCFLSVHHSHNASFSEGSQMWTLFQLLNKSAARELTLQNILLDFQPGVLPRRCPWTICSSKTQIHSINHVCLRDPFPNPEESLALLLAERVSEANTFECFRAEKHRRCCIYKVPGPASGRQNPSPNERRLHTEASGSHLYILFCPRLLF